MAGKLIENIDFLQNQAKILPLNGSKSHPVVIPFDLYQGDKLILQIGMNAMVEISSIIPHISFNPSLEGYDIPKVPSIRKEIMVHNLKFLRTYLLGLIERRDNHFALHSYRDIENTVGAIRSAIMNLVYFDDWNYSTKRSSFTFNTILDFNSLGVMISPITQIDLDILRNFDPDQNIELMIIIIDSYIDILKPVGNLMLLES